MELQGEGIRLDFTTESVPEMEQVVQAFDEYLKNGKADFSFLKNFVVGQVGSSLESFFL